MRNFLITLIFNVSLLSGITYGQIFTDGFNNYTSGDLGNQGGWAPFGPGAQIQVESSSQLNYPGYSGNDLGNYLYVPQASVAWSYKNFTPQSLTYDFSLWISFIIRIDLNNTTGSYVMSLRDVDNKTDGGMLYITQGSSSAYVKFGVCKLSQIVYSEDFSVNAVHLIVMKYSYRVSERDTMYIWVDPVLNSEEPPVYTANAFDAANNDPNWKTSICYIDLRPLNNNVAFSLDGFRLGNYWQQAPLPVILESFTSRVSGCNVNLSWVTSSETNNKGFEILKNNEFAGWVNGKGTTNLSQRYFFCDRFLQPGKYRYTLKQYDYNGNCTIIGSGRELNVDAPSAFNAGVSPNPFNPATNIQFEISERSFVNISVFNSAGKEVDTVMKQHLEPGTYKTEWNASAFPSGIYFCRITAGDLSKTIKLILIK